MCVSGDLLKRTNVLCMKFELLSKGVRKDLAHAPAVVTDVSWPSFAATVSIRNGDFERGRTHVGSDKHPLRELIVIQIRLEHGEVLDLGKTIQVRRDRVIAHERAIANSQP